MTTVTVKNVDASQADDMAPPPGTAIVRPLRHVRAVRERTRSGSLIPPRLRPRVRLARGPGRWESTPPRRSLTGRRRFRPAGPTSKPRSPPRTKGACAATARTGQTPPRPSCAGLSATMTMSRSGTTIVGELVGGFGDVVRSRKQIADVLAIAAEGRQRATAIVRNIDAGSGRPGASPQQDADYLDGVVATLAWVLGEQAEAPSHSSSVYAS